MINTETLTAEMQKQGFNPTAEPRLKENALRVAEASPASSAENVVKSAQTFNFTLPVDFAAFYQDTKKRFPTLKTDFAENSPYGQKLALAPIQAFADFQTKNPAAAEASPVAQFQAFADHSLREKHVRTASELPLLLEDLLTTEQGRQKLLALGLLSLVSSTSRSTEQKSYTEEGAEATKIAFKPSGKLQLPVERAAPLPDHFAAAPEAEKKEIAEVNAWDKARFAQQQAERSRARALTVKKNKKSRAFWWWILGGTGGGLGAALYENEFSTQTDLTIPFDQLNPGGVITMLGDSLHYFAHLADNLLC